MRPRQISLVGQRSAEQRWRWWILFVAPWFTPNPVEAYALRTYRGQLL